MICKNPHCEFKTFVAFIEMDTQIVIGLKCTSCGARYLLEDIEVKKSIKREGWNSVKWKLEY